MTTNQQFSYSEVGDPVQSCDSKEEKANLKVIVYDTVGSDTTRAYVDSPSSYLYCRNDGYWSIPDVRRVDFRSRIQKNKQRTPREKPGSNNLIPGRYENFTRNATITGPDKLSADVPPSSSQTALSGHGRLTSKSPGPYTIYAERDAYAHFRQVQEMYYTSREEKSQAADKRAPKSIAISDLDEKMKSYKTQLEMNYDAKVYVIFTDQWTKIAEGGLLVCHG